MIHLSRFRPSSLAMARASLLLWLVLALAPVRRALEAGMASHMLIQMPALLIIGMMLGKSLAAHWRERVLGAAGGPVAAVLIAVFTLSYWMLPRALDEAIAMPAYELAKFLSLPLLAGVPLVLAWPQLGWLGRGFFWANMLSMLATVGWLYIIAPVRVCNQYLVDDQAQTGRWMAGLALLLALWWLAGLIRGSGPARR